MPRVLFTWSTQLTGIGHNGVLATPPGAEKAEVTTYQVISGVPGSPSKPGNPDIITKFFLKLNEIMLYGHFVHIWILIQFNIH